MSLIVNPFKSLKTWISRRRTQLRLSLRVTISGIVTLLVAQVVHLPLGGLWAVLTAVIVTQMSIGSSLRATMEYSIGTLGGALYAGAIAAILPPVGGLASLSALAIVLAPLALLAAVNPNFRVAPFTAVIVVAGSAATHANPITSAFYRVLEVELGGAIALSVSYLVLPERANVLARRAAATMIDLLSQSLPTLLAGVLHGIDADVLSQMQSTIGNALARYDAAAAEARHERLRPFSAARDVGPLARTLLRLRHDFVMLGRASLSPLPPPLQARLEPLLREISDASIAHLNACSVALPDRRAAPSLKRVDAAFDHYDSEVAALRREGATRTLPEDNVEHFFMLGFVLDQIRDHFKDLARCVDDYAS